MISIKNEKYIIGATILIIALFALYNQGLLFQIPPQCIPLPNQPITNSMDGYLVGCGGSPFTTSASCPTQIGVDTCDFKLWSVNGCDGDYTQSYGVIFSLNSGQTTTYNRGSVGDSTTWKLTRIENTCLRTCPDGSIKYSNIPCDTTTTTTTTTSPICPDCIVDSIPNLVWVVVALGVVLVLLVYFKKHK